MPDKNFNMVFLFDQSPMEVFNAINNVRGWWSESIEGGTRELHDEFIYRHKDLHYTKQKLIEIVPGKKIVWLVTDSSLSFAKDKEEWTGTRISFEISGTGNKTKLVFTHHGLIPEFECYNACSGGWDYYINNSLLPLIRTGKGQPDKKETNPKSKTETIK